jgi:hypothetical protein
MEREYDNADLIELGTASVETQGIVGRKNDGVIQLEVIGLTDD